MESWNKRKGGDLFIVSAPSGAGKTTLCKLLCQKVEGIEHSVSYTTRPPRTGEVNNIDYSFIKKDEFLKMVEMEEFIEWAEVYGNYYGTSLRRIHEMNAAGFDVIMDIDTQGARQLMDKKINATFIFVLPPSLDVLKDRLKGRNTDTEEVVEARFLKAREEIRDYTRYEYVIINEILERSLDDLIAIVKSGRRRVTRIDHTWIEKKFFQEES
jgi:guanylate kinase